MSRVRRTSSGIRTVGISFLFVTLAAAPCALAQAGAPRLEPPLVAVEVSSSPEGTTGVAPAMQNVPVRVPLRPGPHGRPFLAMLAAVPLVTYVGPLAPRGSEVVSPAQRFATVQLVGVGYVVNPRFRFGMIGIFGEGLTGLPAGAATWQLGGVAPVAIATLNHFIIGGGPILGYRSGGKSQSDIGAVVLSGASIPIKKGLALNIATPVTAMFARRVTASVSVAAGISKVF